MPHSSEAQHAPIAELVHELDRLAVAAMSDWQVPGAAIAVVQDDKMALVKAYGQRDVAANLPVTNSTQFLICSITKSFTATAIALYTMTGSSTGPSRCANTSPSFASTTRWRRSGLPCATCCVISRGCLVMTGSICQAIAGPLNCSATCAIWH